MNAVQTSAARLRKAARDARSLLPDQETLNQFGALTQGTQSQGNAPTGLPAMQRQASFGGTGQDMRRGQPTPTVGLSARGKNAVGGETNVGVAFGGATGLSSVMPWRSFGGGMTGDARSGGSGGGFGPPLVGDGDRIDARARPYSDRRSPMEKLKERERDQWFWDRSVWGGAEGGEVEGPGGPKDDLVPAMLSDGEYVMPHEAVMYHGTKRLAAMIREAREAEAPEMEGEPKAPREHKRQKGMMPDMMMASSGMMQDEPPMMPMRMADGGFVSPWERDRQRAEQLDAERPFGGLGLSQTQRSRLINSAVGQKILADQALAEAKAQNDLNERLAKEKFTRQRDADLEQARRARAADANAVKLNMALYNQNMGLSRWQLAQQAAADKAGRESIVGAEALPIGEHGFVPVVRTAGGQVKQAAFQPQRSQRNQIDMAPVPGTNLIVPMIGGKPVSGLPKYETQTQPGPWAEGLSRTTYEPVTDTKGAWAPLTVETTQSPPATTAQPVTIRSQAEYARLPKGAPFVWNGKTYTKQG